MSMTIGPALRPIGKWADALSMAAVYKAFERVVVVVVTLAIMALVTDGLLRLIPMLYSSLAMGSAVPEHELFQRVFSTIFTLLIALEFKRSLIISSSSIGDVVRIRPIILIAMLATVRRYIIADISDVDVVAMLGMSAGILSLGVVYWLVSKAPEGQDATP